MAQHFCEGTIKQSPPGQRRVTTEWGPGVTEHLCEGTVKQSPPGQGGSPRSGDPA
jgi:hypothetical protein